MRLTLTSSARAACLATALALGGCHGTSTSAPPAAYPPHTPSQSRPDVPAWLEEPQAWRVGDWFELREDGDLLFGLDGSWRLRLLARTAAGSEWWESITFGDDAPRLVDAFVLGPRAAGGPLLAAYAGASGSVGVASSATSRVAYRALEDIRSGWNLTANGNVIPDADEFDGITAEDDDVEVGATLVHAQRLSFSKAMGPAEAVGRVWVSPAVPGKTIRVTADGYLFLIPILSEEARLTGFGHEDAPVPELRLPDGAWPPPEPEAPEPAGSAAR
ncbi:MAG: hypothetical protein HY908_27905 [Myxococcales bacterium]|nr:hypothetical protein [Myxococcales bacterium]